MKPEPSSLSRALLLAGALFSTALSALAAPPANDNFASAVALTTGTAKTGTNAEATLQAGEPVPQGQTATSYGGSVWYTWTSTSAGWYEVNTLGSSFDTVLSVWSGSTLTGLTAIHANDDAPDDPAGDSLQSRLMFQAAASTTYRIAVGGWKDDTAPTFASGTISVIVKTGTAPPAAYAVSSTFTPSTVNVTSAAATSSFALNITTPAAWMTVDLSLARPDGKFWKDFFFLPGDKTSGTATSGIYTKALPVPKGMPPGVCKITSLRIDSGVFEYGEDALYPMPASIAALTVTNTGTVDSTAPVVSSVTVSPATVNLNSAAAVDVTVTARITDALAGVDDADFDFRTTGTNYDDVGYGSFTAADRISGTVADGTYRKVVTVYAGAKAGTYTFHITPRDEAGNEGVTPASPPTLTVVKAQPATLTAFTISPASVNVAGADAVVTITATATPTGTNTLQDAYVRLTGSSSRSEDLFLVEIASTPTSTTWQNMITVPRYLKPDTLAAELRVTTLNAGQVNSITFGAGSDADAPLPAGATPGLAITNNGSSDTTPPVVNILSISPTSVAAGSGFTVRVRAQDTLSGITFGYTDADIFVNGPQPSSYVLIEPPLSAGGTGYDSNTFPVLPNGPVADGTAEAFVLVSSDAAPGVVPVKIVVTDRCGNSTLLTSNLTITSGPASPYDAWAATSFTAGDDTTPGGDPERDGLKNLIEFAFGLDPKSPDRRLADPASLADSTGLPVVSLQGAGLAARLRVDYWVPADLAAAGLTLFPEFSDDLENWTTASYITQTLTTVDGRHPAFSADIQAYSAAKPRYVRVRVRLAQ